MKSYFLEIKLESDWHVGLGAGRPGHIDRLIARDHEDLPYIPAKTITGIWRDGCERIARGLDNRSARGPWQAWLEALFGSQPVLDKQHNHKPRPALLEVRPARLPENLRDHLKHPRLRQAVTFIKPGVKIDPETGQALDKHLRFEEVAMGGATLWAAASVSQLAAPEIRIAEALLWAGAKAVERLGGKRRRGLGCCTLSFPGDPEEYLKLLDSGPPGPPPLAAVLPECSASLADLSGDEWVVFDLNIVTQTPVIVPRRTVGNVVRGLDGIPGTHLLRPLVASIRSRLGIDLFPHALSGAMVVSFAWPKVENARGRPVPNALWYDKDKKGSSSHRSFWNLLTEKAPADTQLKGHRLGFLGPDFGADSVIGPGHANSAVPPLPALHEAALSVHTHNTVEDQSQRPNAEVGGVYTYEGLPAQTALGAELRLRKSVADRLALENPAWWEHLGCDWQIGQAKKDDFGLVKIDFRRRDGVQAKEATRFDGRSLTVWLLSPLLIRDERQRLTGRVEDLARVLGGELSSKGHAVTLRLRRSAELPSLFARITRMDGWHAGWGLPRPTLTGFAAGSCFVFDVDGEIREAVLSSLEAGGIGERRAEGFGEVSFNPTLLGAPTSVRAVRDHKSHGMEQRDALKNGGGSPPKVSKADAIHEFARFIEREAWRREIHRRASDLGSDQKWRRATFRWDECKPSNSQLGSLRAAAMGIDDELAADRVRSWIAAVKAVDNRRKNWPDGGLDFLSQLIEPGPVWDELGWPADFPVISENAVEELKQTLGAAALRALLHAAIRNELRDREHI